VALSKREKNIGIGVIGAVALWGLIDLVIEPYFDQLSAISEQQASARQEISDADHLFDRQKQLQKVWQDIRQGGLKSDATQAESESHHALLDWAQAADVNIVSLKPERPMQEGKFQVINFNVSATGSMASCARLVWALETAKIPMRIDELQMGTRREGTDDLTLRFSLSTICMPPDTKASGQVSSAGSAGAGGAS
jgi:Type II secretion system (T2SS), protein M subtype b